MTATIDTRFDVHKALDHQHEKVNKARAVMEEAACLIDDDRPNAAKRLLMRALAGQT